MRTKIEILENIKNLYQLKTDTALAKFLGIATTTLSSWKSRDSIDYDLVFSKCVGVDLNALINGEKMNGQSEQAKCTGISHNLNGQNDGQYIIPCQRCVDKERIITSQQIVIDTLQNANDQFNERIIELKQAFTSLSERYKQLKHDNDEEVLVREKKRQ